MQQHEVPQWQLPKEAIPPLEGKPTKEQSLFQRLGTAVAETVKDIREANDMAKRKFDGDSALMRVARGALTGSVGAGLELATDDMFSKAWRGEGPIFERFIMGENTGKKLAKLSEQHPRLSHFIKEGTQDVALAALYNFIAYRSQPIFTQVESPHVLRSLAADALEAGFIKTIPDEMKTAASAINQPKTDRWQQQRRRFRRPKQKKYPMGGEGAEMMMNEFFKKKPTGENNAKRVTGKNTDTPMSERQGSLGNVFNLSNPVTQLGLEMVWSGMTTFAKNFSELRKARKVNEWSGGKAASSPKGENVYYGNSHGKYYKKRGYDERLDDL
jgi:hypothetical protein